MVFHFCLRKIIVWIKAISEKVYKEHKWVNYKECDKDTSAVMVLFPVIPRVTHSTNWCIPHLSSASIVLWREVGTSMHASEEDDHDKGKVLQPMSVFSCLRWANFLKVGKGPENDTSYNSKAIIMNAVAISKVKTSRSTQISVLTNCTIDLSFLELSNLL